MERNNGGMKSYWKRRTYERVGNSGARRRRTRSTAELGDGRRRRWSPLLWKVKISPKLQFLRSSSPKRILARFNEGYVRIIQRLVGLLGLTVGGHESRRLPEPVEFAYQKKIVERYCTLVPEKEWIAAVSGLGAISGLCATSSGKSVGRL